MAIVEDVVNSIGVLRSLDDCSTPSKEKLILMKNLEMNDGVRLKFDVAFS